MSPDSLPPKSPLPPGRAVVKPSEGPRTITKKELVARIAERTGQTKVVAREVIQLFLDEIIDELGRGNRLEFREFGVFEIKERAARKAQNPRTLEKVDVPAKRVVKFRVGRLMKQRVADIPEGTRVATGAEPYDPDDEDED
jgi:integration host factor subunit beta